MQRSVAAWLGVVLFAATGIAEGQTYQGGVRGLIRDPNGVIPGAEITLTNEETNATRTITTNDVGEYSFANVLPATYSLKVAMQGFRTEERKGLRVGTSTFIVEDFTLQVGAVSEAITVTGETPLVERSNAAVAAALDTKTLETTPIFGRNAFYVGITTPNVIQSGDPQFVRYQDQTNASYLSLGGGPRRGNGYLLEGVAITDFTNRPTIVPSIEAIEDLKVQVKTYDADMGHTAGGVFNTVAKSGSDTWHGSALIIDKPEWGTGELYFAEKAGLPKPPAYYYDWGGSLGGPIVKDRTFFFATLEGYQDKTTRNNVLTFPTAAERTGDFSGAVNAAGQRITIFDPLARDANGNRLAFPNNNLNQIYNAATGTWSPANRIDPVAAAIIRTMPLPTAGTSFNGNAVLVDGPQDQETIKIDQRWNGRWTTTGMYAHQHTFEPGSAFFGTFDSVAGDPGNSNLYRRIDFVALNNIFVPNNTTAIAVRYGYNRFFDQTIYPNFDAASLGFPASYVNQLTNNTFPAIVISGYGGATTMGNAGASTTIHVSQVANTTISKFAGHHSFKFGGDYRRIGINATSFGNSAGTFSFNAGFTQGPNPTAASATAGDSFASFLLGYPASGNVQVAKPASYYVDYYAGYAQDDFRLSAKLTLNFGLRYDFETGLKEQNNQFTVGFDPNAVFPVQVAGLNLKGGLMYAGQNGYPTQQGAPLHDEFAPRGGVAWSLNDKTVVRGGWGLFWAPTQYPTTGQSGNGGQGFSALTTFNASNDGGVTPASALRNPFPIGVLQPAGNSLGYLTGAGGQIDYVDQSAKPGYVQQFSIDFQRELAGGHVVTIGYLGSRSQRLSIGGTADATVNINQLPDADLALGAQLNSKVANPFFGNAVFGNLSTSSTIALGQLLRPFPQFGDILAHRVNEVHAAYNAAVLRWEKRLQHGWAVNANYTYSRLMDNQFGEANSYVNRLGSPLDSTNLESEYGYSLLDVPHRLNFNATFELPFGKGRRWMSSPGVASSLLSGWAVSAAGRYQNGFPTQIWQSSNNSGLFGSTQRPNLVSGASEVISGASASSYDATCQCIRWLNPGAFIPASAFTFGNEPRTDPNARTPGQSETDMNIQKSQRIGGKTITVRLDLLNIFNNPLLFGPVTTVGTANFGFVNTVGGFARSEQLHLRVAW